MYGELDRIYPPVDQVNQARGDAKPPVAVLRPSLPPSLTSASDDGQIQGLGDLPEGWPELPSNASVAADVGWVQAHRLRVVEERPGRATRVHLTCALSPAPSWAALGWLETSIRSYAKFVDVAARAASGDDGESAVVRRERVAIKEMERIIAEMMEVEGACARCGRPT